MIVSPDMTNFPLPVLPALDDEVHNASILDLVLDTSLGQPPAIVFADPGRGLFNNAVRLMDKTVLEYKAARDMRDVRRDC